MSNIIKQNFAQVTAPTTPKVVLKAVIEQMDNGTINLSGFPANLNVALQLMSGATNAIIHLFIEKAKNNDLDSNDTIKQSKIITLPKTQ